MPPFVARKRERKPSPTPSPQSERPPVKKARATLFETVDAPSKQQQTLAEKKKFLASLDDGDHDSTLSEAGSDEFEDVPPAKKQRRKLEEGGNDEDDEEMDWEDAIQQDSSTAANPGPSTARTDQEIGDISVSIQDDGSYIEPTVSAGVNKKGPSKRERQVRLHSHCLHVQALLWHNTIRNSWLSDKELQKTLVDGLTDGVKREVVRWREAMGTLSKAELEAKKKEAAAKSTRKKGKGKQRSTGRDWNYDAEHAEQGVPDLSHGDPLLRLLKVLASYWRKRFVVTAPGLRKQGYKPLRRLQAEIKGWQKDNSDPEEHGEKIESKAQLLKHAKICEGSRDVGGQLFVALLRGLGIETRMVANLQPMGFGWSKAEEVDPKKWPKKDSKPEPECEEDEKPAAKKASDKTLKKTPAARKPKLESARGSQATPISLDDSDSGLSDPPTEHEDEIGQEDDNNDLSVTDVTPVKKKPAKKYDRDLAFPNYWIEACSPVSNKYIPVDPIVLSTIGSTDDLIQSFEPRGKKAENAKQVMCYTVAYSADGSAKDVTIRYIKKHQLPGKTKGMRLPAEKVPVYNRHGKVKKYEMYDWFRTVMSFYDRPEKKRTPADNLEEQTDLKPFKASKEAKEVEKESLQWYKQSAEFVLEQHFRREEALLPSAKPVKTFTLGKGDKVKEHPVYRRKDVVACKTNESWHKEGRQIRVGEQPMKLVPMRAVTLIRKREMEDALRETGEKLQQGLYSEAQTEWIIPPPIENGVIPKNAFGNMDVYVPTMVPGGAVHLPLKGSAKLCRKLGIDYAEACTGFEFGKQRAVPILTGVVVANEHEMLVRDAWRADQREIKRKEDVKRTATSLNWWRKMLLGLRVLDRINEAFKDKVEPASAEGSSGDPFAGHAAEDDTGEDAGAGGFFRPGHDEEGVPQQQRCGKTASSIQSGEDEDEDEDEDVEIDDGSASGGFLVDDNDDDDGSDTAAKPVARYPVPITPVSLQSLHQEDSSPPDLEDEDEERDKPPPRPVASQPTAAEGKKKAASPKVVIPSSARKKARPKRAAAAPRRGRAKTTPRKSGYFAASGASMRTSVEASDDEDDEEGTVDDEESEEEGGEEEVVKPRRTTARTQASGSGR